MSFFSRKEIKVFEENIFNGRQWFGQKALHDPNGGIRILSSEMNGHFLKKYICKHFLPGFFIFIRWCWKGHVE